MFRQFCPYYRQFYPSVDIEMMCMSLQRLPFILTIVMSLIISACQPLVSTDESSPNKITYGLSITVSGIDPHINQSMELGIVLRQVYDTLVYRHPETREFVAGLAESWVISDDGLRYTFDLKQDVQFHDGEPFDAEAVASNLKRIMADETASQRAKLLLGPIAGYQVIDEYTIMIVLNEPYSPLLDGLSQVYTAMASPKALNKYSLLRYQYHQVGTGPYQFIEYIPESRILLRRNPNYNWGPEFYEGVPVNAVEEIEYEFFLDPATRGVALESNDAQIIGELLPTDARAIANNVNFTLKPIAIPGQPLQFYMNTQVAPTNELAVRQALLYGTNRSSIVDIVYGGLSPIAWGPLSAETLYYTNDVVGMYDYDPSRAREILEAVGFADSDNDGFYERNGDILSINLIQPPWGLLPSVVEILQDQWQIIGIQVNVTPVPGFTSLIEQVNLGEYNLVAFDTPGMDPSILNARYLSDGAVNWTGFASTELDAILLEAVQQTRDDLREQLYSQAQVLIMREALILPIRDYVNLNAQSNAISQVSFDPYGWFPLLYDLALVQSN